MLLTSAAHLAVQEELVPAVRDDEQGVTAVAGHQLARIVDCKDMPWSFSDGVLFRGPLVSCSQAKQKVVAGGVSREIKRFAGFFEGGLGSAFEGKKTSYWATL